MSRRQHETNPIPLRWGDGIMIIMTILLLSLALLAQAIPQGAGTFGDAIAFLEDSSANASSKE